MQKGKDTPLGSGRPKAHYVEGVGWRKDTEHAFTRRDRNNDYHAGRRAYMLTLTVEEDAPLFGQLSGSLDAYDAAAPLHHYSPEALPSAGSICGYAASPSPLLGPHVRLSELGHAVLQIWQNMKERYNEIIDLHDDEFVVMPEHLHAIVYVRCSSEKHLSDFEKAFKGCCNAAYRLLLAQGKTAAVGTAREWLAVFRAASPDKQQEMTLWLEKAYQRALAYRATGASPQCLSTWSKGTDCHPTPGSLTPGSFLSGSLTPGGARSDIGAPPIRLNTQGEHGKVGFLFRANYNDKHASSIAKLEEKRFYIRNNPKTRLMRMCHRSRQTVIRQSIDTGISLPALHGYLRRECGPLATAERLADLDALLLVQYSSTWSKNTIHLDYYGEASIISATLLPVVCHRRDSRLFERQKVLLLDKAQQEKAVLVSARIAKGEQGIMDEALRTGAQTVRILLEGFPEKYHPSAAINELCAEGRMLLVSPWQWSYRYSGDTIDPILCKTLNCIAQALCRRKDSFWKEA